MADVSVTGSTTSSSLLSGSIKYTGLGSGQDFSKVVDQLVQIESTAKTRLTTWKQTWVDKETSIKGLNSRLVALKENAADMDEASNFYSRTASVSNSAVLAATATASATAGSHTVVVGQNIPGQVISKSYDSTAAVGGSGNLVITVGTKTLTLAQGAGMGDGTWNPTLTLNQLAQDIKAADAAQPAAQQILGDVYTVTDKTRSGTVYQRLVVTAKDGGSTNKVSVSGGPTANLGLNGTTVDAVMNKTWLFSTSQATSGGTYTGRTNKTFTFAAANTGTLGTDDVTFNWADTEGHTGSFTIKAADWLANPAKTYDVMQGVTVQFSAGRVAQAESFTIDAENSTLQQAQDQGLAQAEKRVHTGFVDLITPINSGSQAEFVYSYGGVQATIQVPDGTTLGALADLINHDSKNPGVTAEVINDGQGTSTSYHLVLTGKATGAAHVIELLASSKPLSNFDSSDAKFSTSQQASDAMIKLDGFPSQTAKYIQRSTNSISDVIPGVTLNLQGVGSTTVTVANDTSAISAKIQQFIQSVNYVQDYIRQETAYDAQTKKSGIMIGNYTYEITYSTVNDLLARSIPGLVSGTDAYTHLSEIGIKTDPDNNGIWVIDSTTLNNALNSNPDAVARLFIGDSSHSPQASTGAAKALYDKLLDLTDNTKGIANVLTNNYDGIISDIDAKITSETKRIAQYRTDMESKFARLETQMSTLNGLSTSLTSYIAKLNSK